jgi:two-component system chemotaxis sensor kinase CheA
LDFDQECLNDFIEESIENLDMLDDAFIKIEKDPEDTYELDNIFRVVHTMKGGCRLIGMPRLEGITHVGESLLDMARSKEVLLSRDHITLLLKTIDVLRFFVDYIRENNVEPEQEFERLKGELEKATQKKEFSVKGIGLSEDGESEESHVQSEVLEAEAVENQSEIDSSKNQELPPPVEAESQLLTEIEVEAAEPVDSEDIHESEEVVTEAPVAENDGIDWSDGLEGSVKVEPPSFENEPVQNEPAEDESVQEAESKEDAIAEPQPQAVAAQATAVLVQEEPVVASAPPEEEFMKKKEEAKSDQPTKAKTKKKLPTLVYKEKEKKVEKTVPMVSSEGTVRIDVRRLDKLMDLVGELVLSRNQLKQINGKMADPLLNGTTSAISMITSELQEEIVKSRLQPISTVMSKFQRMIRDLSLSLDKEVELELKGMGTELDRTLLESIRDPLTHLIRNSVDHGIELPSVREAKGKPRLGTISIHCFHDGGQVVINIVDDGAGLDAGKIGLKAISRKLVTKEQLALMSAQEIYRFIFHPGFSTADQVTSISGRGVGMDVVNTNITSIGGQIDLDSIPGHETTIRLQIPLTLAIIPALMVQIEERNFAIPQTSLQELIFLDRDDFSKVESFDGTEVFRLRGQLLPLIRLRPLMRVPEVESEYFYIVVLVSGEQKFGLIVDEVQDTEEIVVKPLAKFFNGVRFFSGATILGDGSISLILDVEAVAKSADVNSQKSLAKGHSQHLSRTKAASTVLMFSMGGEEIFGVQMSQISRLEEIELKTLEKSGSQEVIQYRGQILPVVRLSKQMDLVEDFGDVERVSLIVFDIEGREAGLLVKEIVDAHPLEGDLDTTVFDHPLILGTMMIRKDIVMMLDAQKVFEMNFPRWKNAEEQRALGMTEEIDKGCKKVLYVDDSSFYLKVVGRYLKDAGYEIDVAKDGLEGLEKVRETVYDLLIVDYEMPNLDGLGMIADVRTMPEYEFVPIIVLTAMTGGQEKVNLINSGIQSYLVKLNKEELLKEVSKLLELEPLEV